VVFLIWKIPVSLSDNNMIAMIIMAYCYDCFGYFGFFFSFQQFGWDKKKQKR